MRNVVATLVLAAVLFGGSGNVLWPAAWVFLGAYVSYVVATAAVAVVRHPDLLAERVGLPTATVTWDRWLAPVSGVVFPAVAVLLAALDRRFDWTPLPDALWLVGLAGLIAGYALLLAAMAVNRFFSAGVRIQHERGQTAICSGPYSFVRHPGYAGLIALLLAIPLLLDSGIAAFPALVAVSLTVLRAAWEDQLLRRELAGYASYAVSVRYRLAPGVW